MQKIKRKSQAIGSEDSTVKEERLSLEQWKRWQEGDRTQK